MEVRATDYQRGFFDSGMSAIGTSVTWRDGGTRAALNPEADTGTQPTWTRNYPNEKSRCFRDLAGISTDTNQCADLSRLAHQDTRKIR
jgi:hypothetical protein